MRVQERADSREGLAAFYEQLVCRRPIEQELDEAFPDEDGRYGSS